MASSIELYMQGRNTEIAGSAEAYNEAMERISEERKPLTTELVALQKQSTEYAQKMSELTQQERDSQRNAVSSLMGGAGNADAGNAQAAATVKAAALKPQAEAAAMHMLTRASVMTEMDRMVKEGGAAYSPLQIAGTPGAADATKTFLSEYHRFLGTGNSPEASAREALAKVISPSVETGANAIDNTLAPTSRVMGLAHLAGYNADNARNVLLLAQQNDPTFPKLGATAINDLTRAAVDQAMVEHTGQPAASYLEAERQSNLEAREELARMEAVSVGAGGKTGAVIGMLRDLDRELGDYDPASYSTSVLVQTEDGGWAQMVPVRDADGRRMYNPDGTPQLQPQTVGAPPGYWNTYNALNERIGDLNAQEDTALQQFADKDAFSAAMAKISSVPGYEDWRGAMNFKSDFGMMNYFAKHPQELKAFSRDWQANPEFAGDPGAWREYLRVERQERKGEDPGEGWKLSLMGRAMEPITRLFGGPPKTDRDLTKLIGAPNAAALQAAQPTIVETRLGEKALPEAKDVAATTRGAQNATAPTGTQDFAFGEVTEATPGVKWEKARAPRIEDVETPESEAALNDEDAAVNEAAQAVAAVVPPSKELIAARTGVYDAAIGVEKAIQRSKAAKAAVPSATIPVTPVPEAPPTVAASITQAARPVTRAEDFASKAAPVPNANDIIFGEVTEATPGVKWEKAPAAVAVKPVIAPAQPAAVATTPKQGVSVPSTVSMPAAPKAVITLPAVKGVSGKAEMTWTKAVSDAAKAKLKAVYAPPPTSETISE